MAAATIDRALGRREVLRLTRRPFHHRGRRSGLDPERLQRRRVVGNLRDDRLRRSEPRLSEGAPPRVVAAEARLRRRTVGQGRSHERPPTAAERAGDQTADVRRAGLRRRELLRPARQVARRADLDRVDHHPRRTLAEQALHHRQQRDAVRIRRRERPAEPARLRIHARNRARRQRLAIVTGQIEGERRLRQVLRILPRRHGIGHPRGLQRVGARSVRVEVERGDRVEVGEVVDDVRVDIAERHAVVLQRRSRPLIRADRGQIDREGGAVGEPDHATPRRSTGRAVVEHQVVVDRRRLAEVRGALVAGDEADRARRGGRVVVQVFRRKHRLARHVGVERARVVELLDLREVVRRRAPEDPVALDVELPVVRVVQRARAVAGHREERVAELLGDARVPDHRDLGVARHEVEHRLLRREPEQELVVEDRLRDERLAEQAARNGRDVRLTVRIEDRQLVLGPFQRTTAPSARSRSGVRNPAGAPLERLQLIRGIGDGAVVAVDVAAASARKSRVEGRHARRVRVRSGVRHDPRGVSIGHRLDRRGDDVGHHDRRFLPRHQCERTRSLVEARVGGGLVQVADRPLGRRRDPRVHFRRVVARKVAGGGVQVTGQVPPQLLVAERIREPGARVVRTGEQRESYLFPGVGVDRASQVLDPDDTRRVREERREEQVGRIDELGRGESAVVRHPEVERQNGRGEVLTGVRHVHVGREGGVHLVQRDPAGRQPVLAAEELQLVRDLEVLRVRHVLERVDEVQHRLVPERIVPREAALRDLDPHRVLTVRDPGGISVPVLHPGVLLGDRRAAEQRVVVQIRIVDDRLVRPVGDVIRIQRVEDVRNSGAAGLGAPGVEEEGPDRVVRPVRGLRSHDSGDLQAGVEDVGVRRSHRPGSAGRGGAVEHVRADVPQVVDSALDLVGAQNQQRLGEQRQRLTGVRGPAPLRLGGHVADRHRAGREQEPHQGAARQPPSRGSAPRFRHDALHFHSWSFGSRGTARNRTVPLRVYPFAIRRSRRTRNARRVGTTGPRSRIGRPVRSCPRTAVRMTGSALRRRRTRHRYPSALRRGATCTC